MNLYLLLILTVLSILDFKYREVNDWYYILFLPLIQFDWMIVGLFVLLSVSYKYIQTYIGGADIKISLIMLMVLGYDSFLLWLMYSALFGLIFMLVKQIRLIPFVPFMLMGYLCL